MAKTTFSGVLRSGGGDTTKTAYAGTVELIATFYLDPTAANTTAVQRSATDTRSVVLPAGAIVTEVQVNAAATGGTNPTFDLGWIGVSDATALDVDGLIAEGDADAGKTIFNWATGTAGASMGATVSSGNQMFRVTGGVGASAATGGDVSGYIKYHVSDNGAYTA